MKQGWEYGVLDDAVDKDSSNISLNKIKDDDGDYPVYGAKGFVQNVSFYQQKIEYLGVIKDGAGIGRVSKHPPKSSILATMQYLIPKEGYDIKFINYFLNHIDLSKFRTGSTIPHIYYKDYKSEPFPVVALDDQKRIVAKLDECFEAIDKARANVEKNLQNAKELFQSQLNQIFSKKKVYTFDTIIGDQITLQRGFDITKKQQRPGNVPVVSSGGVKSFHDSAMVKSPGVVIGRKGTIGKVYYLEKEFWPHDTTLWIKNFNNNNPKFVYYFFSNLDLKALDSGAANPALNRNNIHPIAINWIIPEKQNAIVNQLDHLKSQTQSLEGNYQQELNALDELKKSILQRAFNGEL